MIELNECKPTFENNLLYAIYDGSSSRIFDFEEDFDFENTNNKDFKIDYTLTEVGSVPGRIMGFWNPGDLYVHTTKGVYEYPDFELRGLK